MGARGFFGGLFGNVNSSQDSAVPAMQSGVYSLDDQYASKREGGWFVPMTGTVTGGTIYPGVSIDGNPYNIHKFTHPNSATLVISGSGGSGAINQIDITLVGGGGGAGAWANNYAGGGGGGGGVRHAQGIQLIDGTYPITVGDGGAGAPPGPTPATNKGEAGESTIFNNPDGNSYPKITATGGGYGGVAGGRGGPGGSGGGKSYPNDPGSPDLGNAGGDDPRCTPEKEGYDSTYPGYSRPDGANWRCGGGGGAGTGITYPGPTPASNKYMVGANGLTIPRLGAPGDPWLPTAGNVFGGGGGGSSYKEANGNGPGGTGGGGYAGSPNDDDATANTGGGGGGAGQSPDSGGNGGEGIVYVRVPGANTSNPG